MNSSVSHFLQISEPLSTTVSSPKLDAILQAWNHIADRYLARITTNRKLAGRVRSIRLLAVHDAIQSVIDPGNGWIFKETSNGTTTEAAIAAAVKASHDILAAIFTQRQDRGDLADLLDESLALVGKEAEKAAGVHSGTQSANVYIRTFVLLLLSQRPEPISPSIRKPLELVHAAGRGGY